MRLVGDEAYRDDSNAVNSHNAASVHKVQGLKGCARDDKQHRQLYRGGHP